MNLIEFFWGAEKCEHRGGHLIEDFFIIVSFLSPSGSSYGRGRIIRGDLIARIPDIWYMVYDIWYMVDDIWYKLHYCIT